MYTKYRYGNLSRGSRHSKKGYPLRSADEPGERRKRQKVVLSFDKHSMTKIIAITVETMALEKLLAERSENKTIAINKMALIYGSG